MNKTYIGKRLEEGCEVYVKTEDGKQYPLPDRREIRRHSLTGFEWGYGGSGPAQLALAILADHFGPKPCPDKCPYCESVMHKEECTECHYQWAEDKWRHIQSSGAHYRELNNWCHYQEFKFGVIAHLPKDGFELTTQQVEHWINSKYDPNPEAA